MEEYNLAGLSIFFCQIFLASVSSYSNRDAEEFCLDDTFAGRCKDNEVIQIHEALYGRLQIGKCVQQDMGFLGCKLDVKLILHDACSGRSQCLFAVDKLFSKKPCGELAAYLTVAYSCRQVLSAPESRCRSSRSHELVAEDSQGYISSHVARRSGCGDMNHPWRIETLPGQRVNISLHKYGEGNGRSSGKCKTLGYITEIGHRNNVTICDKTGEHHVYTSNGRNIHIYINTETQQETASEFLLHYQVFGCADLKVPQNAWYKREGSVANIGCEGQDVVWRLKCDGNQWNGVIGNCTERVAASTQQSSNMMFLNLDLRKLTIICIAVGFVILIVIAGTVIFWKWRESNQHKPPSTILLQEEQYRMNKGPLPPGPQDNSHYRSLIRQPDPQAFPPHSQTMTRSQGDDDYSADWRFGTTPWQKQQTGTLMAPLNT